MKKWRIVVNRALELSSEFGRFHRKRWHNLKRWFRTTDFFPVLVALGLAATDACIGQAATLTARWGAPFLLLQTLLSPIVALPLLFTELGLGQFSSQTVTAVWRAVPALRGVAFAKLTCAGVYAMCTSIRLAIALGYTARTVVHQLPLTDCSQLTMTENGYAQNNTLGMECAVRTFLKPCEEDTFWFSIMIITIFVVWIIIPLCVYSLEKGMKYSVSLIFALVVVLGIILAIAIGENVFVDIMTSGDWSDLASSELWFTAMWHVLLANRVGVAFLENAGGTIYFRGSAMKWSIVIVSLNVLFGWLGAFFWYSITPGVVRASDVVTLPLWIYDAAVASGLHRFWSSFSFILLDLTVASSMMTFLYPIIGTLARSYKYNWRLVGIIGVSFSVVCSALLFHGGMEAVKFTEEVAVPSVVVVLIGMEVVALLFIYGWKNVRLDLEFMLGNYISLNWIIFLGLSSLIVLALTVWNLTMLVLGGWPGEKGGRFELVVFASLAGVVLVTVVVWAVILFVKQDEFGVTRKICKAFHPSRKWGPVESTLRHLWMEWQARKNRAELFPHIRAHRNAKPRAVFYINSNTSSVSNVSIKSVGPKVYYPKLQQPEIVEGFTYNRRDDGDQRSVSPSSDTITNIELEFYKMQHKKIYNFKAYI